MCPHNAAKLLFDCVAVPSPSFSKNKTLVSELQQVARRVVLNEGGVKFDEARLTQFLNEHKADGAIIGTDPLSSHVISNLKHLRSVGKYGVGCDNVDVEALKKANIYFGWEGGVNRRSVSELALGFMLGHARNIFKSVTRMQASQWEKNGGFQISGKTIGIVGFGFIGTDLATLLKPFGCTVLVNDIMDKSSEARALGAKQVSYLEILEKSDVITFHVPGGALTKHLFGAPEIAKTKPTCLIINTARGHICDFNAVTSAVKSGRLGGYAADVFPEEPLIQNQLTVEQGFYFSPHIGGNAEEAVLAMGRAAIKGLVASRF
jgi:D-3-phosphoglycerate dehydrogenase